MAYTIDNVKAKIQSYPTKKPIYNAALDSGGDLVFRMVDQRLEIPFNNPDGIEQMIVNSVRTQTISNEDGTFKIENDVDSTFSLVISKAVEELKEKLMKSSTQQDPKRTKLHKWFRGYNPRTDDEKKLMLLIYDYVYMNDDCKIPGSKHAQNFVGLITHVWSKYGSGK